MRGCDVYQRDLETVLPDISRESWSIYLVELPVSALQYSDVSVSVDSFCNREIETSVFDVSYDIWIDGRSLYIL